MSDVSLLEAAIKHLLGTLAVTPVAFRDQSLVAVAVLLPVFDAHVIEIAQLSLVHHDPYRCAEESVFDACWFPKRGFEVVMAVYPMGSGRLFKCVRLNVSGGTPNEAVF